ncbi:FAS-associated factor 2 [Ischnura elegans]|uniref:FAS-associated factor 2 n=1 Tax=Ischnura elegans TaxID=197161 RepID=UPI001ED883CC|nr:FAS-associated factor 2 [Ischnura elegans]
MADNQALSAEETEKLLQLQELTGIDDMSVCRDVLQRHSWDLEVAVQDQLNMREGRPSVFFSSRERDNPVPVMDAVGSGPSRNIVPMRAFPSGSWWRWGEAAGETRRRGITGFITGLFSFVFRLCYGTIASIIFSAVNMFRPDPRLFGSDPVTDVAAFVSEFESNFGPQHPVFFRGSYSDALAHAKRDLRFLLVYLHSPQHQDTPTFCRCTLGDPDFVAFVDAQALFWGCSVTSPEGYRVALMLRECSYPFLALLVLRDTRMTVVGRLEGAIGPRELIATLQELMSENEASLIAARADRNERSFTQTLRRQQDEAYEESLRADREKERRRQEEREREEEERRRVEEAIREEQRRIEEIRKQKIDWACRVPDEPSADDPEAVYVVIKLPSGKRLERRFRLQHSLQCLYYYVFCHPDSPDSFEIATNFPKRVLQCMPTDTIPCVQTFEEAGLRRGEVLFVYDLEA